MLRTLSYAASVLTGHQSPLNARARHIFLRYMVPLSGGSTNHLRLLGLKLKKMLGSKRSSIQRLMDY